MWLIVEPILIKFAIEEVVNILVKAGVMSATTGSLIKTVEELKIAVSDIKFYHEPTDFPSPPPGQTNISNISEG